MSDFGYDRAIDCADAAARGRVAGSAFLAGGTDLLQLWKAGRCAPDRLVDISRLPIGEITTSGGLLTLGATARLSDVAAHPAVVANHPLLAQSIAASASGQLRNMATVAGNLLQRTRCSYFRTTAITACNKHRPGTGCGAIEGVHRQAALFGTGPLCVATHASDLAVALLALDAEVLVLTADGPVRTNLAQLHRQPGETPHIDTILAPGDLITGVEIRDGARFSRHSTYLKVRDRGSFEFAIVAVAAALLIEDGIIVEARLAAGGVGTVPWRLTHSEAKLVGKPADMAIFTAAGALATEGAQPLADNRFKMPLLRSAVVRALEIAVTPR